MAVHRRPLALESHMTKRVALIGHPVTRGEAMPSDRRRTRRVVVYRANRVPRPSREGLVAHADPQTMEHHELT